MKTTANNILLAIGMADEKTIKRTEPFPDVESDEKIFEDSIECGRKGIFMQHITAIGALCAAIVFCIFAGWGISRLRAANTPADKDKREAREVLEAYMDACKEGDFEKAESMIWEKAVWYGTNEEGEEYVDLELTHETHLTDMQMLNRSGCRIIECSDIMDYIQEGIQAEKDMNEYYILKLRKQGKTELADEIEQRAAEPNDLEEIEKAYSFKIQIPDLPESMLEYLGNEEGQTDISVYWVNGKWMICPDVILFPTFGAKEELEELRAETEAAKAGTAAKSELAASGAE